MKREEDKCQVAPAISTAIVHEYGVLLQVATEWLYSVPEHVLDKHLGNEPSTPTQEAEAPPEDPRRCTVPKRVPLQVLSQALIAPPEPRGSQYTPQAADIL